MSESLKDEAARQANTVEDGNGNALRVGDFVTVTGKILTVQPPDAQYGKDGIDLSNKNGMVEVALNGVINGQTVHVFSSSIQQVEANLRQPDPTPVTPPVAIDTENADAGVTAALGS